MSGLMDYLFREALRKEQDRAANATGDTPQDFKYGPGEGVRRASMSGYVYVTFHGKEYGPVRETFGALDGDKNKSTVLIQASDGKYWKLWYLDSDVK